ncbi:MAG: glycosyltransferase family 4 protein [Nocardioides sp.]
MRILHLTDHYQPVLGGIETHVSALATRHAARGDDVSVLTSTPASVDGRHSTDLGPVTVHRVRSAFDMGRIDLTSYDVVHAHVSVVAPFTAPVAAMAARQGVPTVVTVHSLWSGLGPVPAAAAAIAGLRRAPVLWTAVSRVAAEQLAARLPGDRRVPVLPNAVEVGPRARTPQHEDGRPVRLVSTMRVARRKRPLQLLRMFDDLRRSTTTPVELIIVGDGPLRTRVERRLRDLDLARSVSVTGRLEPAEVLRTLATADVYVAPAILESFGLAALEARCVGLPVVGHSASGMTEFVRDGVEGWLSPSDGEMVDRLVDLVDDPALRHRVAEHNRTTPSSMTWSNALDHNDAAYQAARASARDSGRRAVRQGLYG